MKVTTFDALPVGAVFECNGIRCRKVSTRTADVLELSHARRFYYGKREQCRLIAPEYRPGNPKIDFLTDEDGRLSSYLASTNHFRTCADALAYYSGQAINGRKVTRAIRA